MGREDILSLIKSTFEYWIESCFEFSILHLKNRLLAIVEMILNKIKFAIIHSWQERLSCFDCKTNGITCIYTGFYSRIVNYKCYTKVLHPRYVLPQQFSCTIYTDSQVNRGTVRVIKYSFPRAQHKSIQLAAPESSATKTTH